jgi:hypothetical protein
MRPHEATRSSRHDPQNVYTFVSNEVLVRGSEIVARQLRTPLATIVRSPADASKTGRFPSCVRIDAMTDAQGRLDER